jgi:8-oxo-dGTP pyrophosphatase MutT (NUDIX family)
MIFHRSTSLFLSVIIFFQAIAPALAVPPDSIDTLERHSLRLRTASSVPSGLSFKAQQGKTAAGILLYGMHEGEVHILLGQRNDHPEHWCNLGGGSEEADGAEAFLFHTAARETEEESNQLYCSHPYLVKNQPYIDMYDGSLLYRMYWQKVQYLDREILNARLNGATTTGRELKEFLWVRSHHLLEAVKTQKPLIRIDEERSIEIYPELFSTLSTPSGKAFLENLVEHQRIKRFTKEVRPLVNQLYWVGDNLPSDDLEPMPPQSWPAVDVRMSRREQLAKQLQHWQGQLTQAQAAKGKKRNKARKVQHAHNVVKELQSELDKHPNSWNPLAKPSDKTTFARAVAAHLAMLIEFKRRFSKFPKEELVSEKAEPVESYTDMSLRIILGPDYKTDKDFPEAQDSQDKADTLNIETFLDRYYGPDEVKDGKRAVSVLPSDISFIKSLLKKSRQNGLQPLFYNATSESIYGLFMFFTHLREYIMAMPLKGLAALRGTDIYFKGVETMGDVIQKYGYSDYHTWGLSATSQDERKNSVLCGNFTALAGLKTTRTSSSSLEYAMNDHAVAPPDLGSAIQEALALSGFNNPTSKYFDSLFQQFVSHLHREYANSVMLAIRMAPELLESHTYAAFGGGSPFTQEVKTDDKSEKQIVTPSQVFEGLKAEAERQKDSPEPFEKDIERKRHLIPEVRILLSPRIMFTEGVHVKPTSRFPMNKESKEEFKDLSHFTCMAMIGDWLSEENCILEGSFHQYPVAKKLYKEIHLGLTGRPVEEKLSFEGFFYLVRNGHYEVVKEYLANYPTLVKETAYSSERMIIAALKSNSQPMLQLIFEDLKDVLQVDLLDEQIATLVRIAQDSGWGYSAYFLSEYLDKHSKTIPERFFPTFCQLFQPKPMWGISSEDDLMKRLYLISRFVLPSAPEWFKDKIKHMVINQMSLEILEFICNKILFPRKVISPLDVLLGLQHDLSSTVWGRGAHYALKYQRLFLKQEEQENLLLHQGITGDPLVFGLARWKVPLCKDLMTYLQGHPEVLTLKNKEGLTLLGAAQKAHLEGHSSENLTSLLLLYKEARLDIKQESYPPFFALYGSNYQHKDYAFELVYTQNCAWAMRLAEATPGDLSELLETCPDSRLLERFRYKLDNLRLPKIIEARQSLENAESWARNLQIALETKRRGSGSQSETNSDFGNFADVAESRGDSSLAAFMRIIQASQDVDEDQFPHMSPFKKDTSRPALSTLLSHIPESIDSLQHLVEELHHADYWERGIVEFFQSLPEYNEVKETLENRKESLPQKRELWVEQLRPLVQEGDKSKIYAYVQTMPYLLKDQIEEVKSLLEPYYMQPSQLKADASNLISFLYSYIDPEVYSNLWSERIKKAENNPKEIQEFLQNAPAPVLRKFLILFLRKDRLSYLPELLERAYSNSHDFAQEYEFRAERYDVYPTISSTYHHPFPYVLNGEDPVKMVECFLPFLNSEDAPRLLDDLTGDQFCAVVKKNKRSDVEALVNLVPWMFQWRQNAKDFFLLSIKFLPKTALRQLLMKNLNLLKESETNQRYLPYFVYLMMDGQNESIVKDALHKDPSLLELKSLDGLGMEDFLTFYASPAIAKVVREFQKGVSKQ